MSRVASPGDVAQNQVEFFMGDVLGKNANKPALTAQKRLTRSQLPVRTHPV